MSLSLSEPTNEKLFCNWTVKGNNFHIFKFFFLFFFMSYWEIALVAVFFLLATLFLTLKLYSGQNVGKIVLIYLKKKYFH